MLVESNGIKMRQALFFKHVELIEKGASYDEMESELLKIVSPVDDSILGELYSLSEKDVFDGLATIVISHSLGKISDSELSDEYNKRQKLYDQININTAQSLQYPNQWTVVGYLPTQLDGEKELGYPTLRKKYDLPLEGDIATMDTMIEVELKPI